MGGFGSGERWSKKATVEGSYSIDTTTLKRGKLLTPGLTDHVGVFLWRRGGEEESPSVLYTLTVGESGGRLRLLYSMKSGCGLDYSVRLVSTPCHLGGVRWWFTCPLAADGRVCGRRVRKLYLRGTHFGCRRCHGLTYRSCQESDKRVYALLRAGLDGMGDPRRMSIPQLGIALKALALQQKRIDRWLGKED
jgi:hypothetical protein